ncbi:MAG TPA: capsid cement protein [archaeon]|nr:capsid cement protein [archaeon]
MAIKLRERLQNTDTFTVGSSDIARGKCAVLNSGVVDASGANAAKFVGITTEIGYSGKDVRIAQGGSTVLALAADNSISEGDWLLSDADGKVTTAAAASQGTVQYFVGYALKASSAEDQLIPVVVWPVRVDNPSP